MEEYVNPFTSFLANLLEIIAAFIIGIASLQSFYLRKDASSKAEIRLKLGSSLALGLEF